MDQLSTLLVLINILSVTQNLFQENHKWIKEFTIKTKYKNSKVWG